MTAGRAADHLALTLYINGAPLVRHMPAASRRLVWDRSDIGQLRQSLELGPPESIDEHATPGA
jgi:hypothetical protein